MTAEGYRVRDLTEDDLDEIATWTYDGPWSVYDSDGRLVDVGVGMRPDLVGRGTGAVFARTGTHPVGDETYVVLERAVRPG